MKKILLISVIAVLFLKSYSQDIVLLHSNDLHSKLNGYAPEFEYTPLKTGNDDTRGGFSRIAGIIRNEKKKNTKDIVLTVDAGDFLMGSLFHPLERETGFQLGLMKKMGYDYLSIGNHEFDYGPEGLAEIINNAIKNSEIPQLLLTNVEFDDDDKRDDALEKLFQKGVIKKYAIHEEKGVKIAFLGIMGEDATEVQPYLSPVEIKNPYRVAGKIAKKLKKAGKADVVIVLSHSGVSKENDQWGGEDVKLANRGSKYIDAVISAHTHTTLKDELMVEGVPVLQTGTGGKNIGKLILESNENEYGFKDFNLMPVDDEITGEAKIQDLINKQQKLINEKILSDFGIKYNEPVFETKFELNTPEYGDLDNSNLGPLLVDAIYNEINSNGIDTDISILAAGVIRSHVKPGNTGKQGIADVFRVCPLGQGDNDIPGYALAQIYLTGKEIKKLMEVLIMVRESQPASYSFFSGVKVFVDFDKWFLNKVQKIELGNKKDGWNEIDISRKNDKLYAVSANAYMLEFLGMIKKKTFGLVSIKPKLKDGTELEQIRDAVLDFNKNKEGVQEGKEWLAFYHFVKTFPDKDNNGIPDVPEFYKNHTNPVIDID